MAALFSDGVRTDWTPATPNESLYRFIDRSATPFFAEVRRLLAEWLDEVPESDRSSLAGSLRSSDQRSFEAAFWELYLHEAYRRSGHQMTIHPEVPGTTTHPDFLVEGNGTRFYLEAVRVNVSQAKTAEDRRLNDVHAVLDSMNADRFTVNFSVYAVGPNPLPTKELRRQLPQWLDSLDPTTVAANFAPHPGFATLPQLRWAKDGWELEFHALPLKSEAAGKNSRFVGMFGPGEAQIVDNISGLLRALDAKANKYGALDAPLVIAVLANTAYPTRDYEVEQALFGLSAQRPAQAAAVPDELFREGHWLTRCGRRRGHVPQVIAAQGLSPWRITRVQPRLWNTLEPSVVMPTQPSWLAQVSVAGPELTITEGQSLKELFGLPSDWLAGDPEFRLTT